MLGGVYSCGSGFWQQSDAASPIFPCTFSSYDLHPATQTFQLVPGGIYSGTLSSPPVSLWQHTLVPRAGAITQATVGGNPAIVTWTLGTGKVAVVGLTPHGVVGANSVWWNDSRWAGSVIEPLLNWLLTPNPPNNIGLPSIAGFAVKGQTLTCSTGSWGGSPSSYTYQWVNSLTGNVGTGSTYVLQASDVGARMTCIVTAINTYGSATATSSSTGIVVNAAVTTTVTIASTIARAPVASTPIG